MTRLNHLFLLVTLRRRFGQRLHRTGYFLFGLALGLVHLLLAGVVLFVFSQVLGLSLSPENLLENGAFRTVDLGLSVVIGLIRQYLIVRRLHDFNRSGWWGVIFLLPVPWPPFQYALIVLSIVILFVPGTRGPNRYGYRRDGYAPLSEGVPTLDGRPPF